MVHCAEMLQAWRMYVFARHKGHTCNPGREEPERVLDTLKTMRYTRRDDGETIDARHMRNLRTDTQDSPMTKYYNPFMSSGVDNMDGNTYTFLYVSYLGVLCANNRTESRLREPTVYGKVRSTIRANDTIREDGQSVYVYCGL